MIDLPPVIMIQVSKDGIIEDIDVAEYVVNDYAQLFNDNTIERGNIYGNLLSPAKFGWWIESIDDADMYHLYAFDDAQFIQGFISICNAFNVDFRDYIFGPPFKYNHNTKEIIYYTIQGYEIDPIP